MLRRPSIASGALGALAVAATLAGVLATRRAAAAAGSPIDPAGGWRTVWILACAIGFAAYVLATLLARRGPVPLVLATAVAAAVQLLPLAAPLLLSRDAYLYWAEARVVTLHGANPYRTTPSAYPADPATRAASVQWRTQTEPYGPAWVGLGTLPAAAAGASARHAQLAYRVLAALGLAVAVALAACRRGAAGAIVVGWNPLLALHYAGGGHSDAWMIVALLGALLVPRSAAGGALWVVSAAFKGVTAVFLPLELARTRFRAPRAFWAALLGTAALLVVAATAAFGTRWATGAAVGAHGSSPLGGVHFLVEAGLRHRYAVVVGALVFLVVYAALLRETWRTGRTRLALAAAALCMTTSLFRPWYALWPVALAGIEGEVLGTLAAVALSGYALFADAVP